MITFKCKMCGGDLEITDGSSICECPYCGTQQTLPKADDDQRANRYNRANHFRRQNEFDKAIAAYEKILEENDQDAEAHWGVVLSRFGIEYVEDPKSQKRIPTCHRVQIASILTDKDYQAAVKYAPDTQSRQLYEQQASEIAEIQKRILAVSQNEKPYDVFICYKETDEHNQRTRDSAMAQEVYYGLTEQGYKVFFSRITLEDKLGQEYEPYIFAALHSAKVMVVIGTKPEYFNAVWVKNEWNRYLANMANDRHRLLIPCYRDMDPYDLPDELSNLQSQDMSKIGFIQDLIRGIKKTLASEKNDSQTGISTSQMQPILSAGSLDALLERVYLSIEDGEFEKADELCEMVLNIDARNARAYLGKLLASLKSPKIEGLEYQAEPFDLHPQYKKILRFGDEQLVSQLQAYNQSIRDRNKRIHDADTEVAEIIKKFRETTRMYCLAECVITSERETLKKTEKAIGNRKKEINHLQDELDHLGGIFTGRRRKELEIYIAQGKKQLTDLEKKEEHSKSIIDNARKTQTIKPDHKMMVYQIGTVYYHKALFGKAAKEYIKILSYYGAISELISKDDKLKEEIDSLRPYKDKYIREEEEEAKSIYESAFEKAKREIKNKIKEAMIDRFRTVGNTVQFGSFMQVTNAENEPIEWIVVSCSNDCVQLVSKYGIETRPYHSVQNESVTWERSTIRKWLNEDFYQIAFSEKEKDAIDIREVANDRSQGNKNWISDGGSNTNDRVFLLSCAEAQSLLSESQRICTATQYAQSNGATVWKEGIGLWWLRSPGRHNLNVSYVHTDGKYHEFLAENNGVLLRPSIWVDLKKLSI